MVRFIEPQVELLNKNFTLKCAIAPQEQQRPPRDKRPKTILNPLRPPAPWVAFHNSSSHSIFHVVTYANDALVVAFDLIVGTTHIIECYKWFSSAIAKPLTEIIMSWIAMNKNKNILLSKLWALARVLALTSVLATIRMKWNDRRRIEKKERK